jgi:protease IV
VRKLLSIFAFLLVLAGAAATAGILLSRGAATSGGPVVLVWRIAGPLPEQAVARSLPFGDAEETASMPALHRAFAAAKKDPRVRGIAVYFDDVFFGLAKAQEFRRQFAALRAAGRFAHCYLDTAGEGSNGTLAYYLASACDQVTISPNGELNLLGLYAGSAFVRGTLDKLKIEPDFLQVGAYKSATEMYTLSERSPESEATIAALLDSNYAQVVADIATSRRLAPAAVRSAIDTAPHGAAGALALGFVDALAYADAFHDAVEKAGGGAPSFVSVLDYRPRLPRTAHTLAVLSAEGTILRGTGGFAPWTEEVFIGSQDLGGQLAQLRDDDEIAAVVLRIDSPGGSALASDLILHEVERLRAKKPVVVSMSDVAASGGYYIAARATKIVAEGTTLTGSIGVFAGKLATRRFQQDLLGITHDASMRGARADLYSSLDPFTADQAAIFGERMRATYDAFVGHVAAGRGLAVDAVEKVAAGRVWTGADALRVGLVDELGGIDRALALASAAAGLGDEAFSVVYYPEPPTLFDALWRRSRPALPAQLSQLLSAVRPRPAMALELAPELRSLARPF